MRAKGWALSALEPDREPRSRRRLYSGGDRLGSHRLELSTRDDVAALDDLVGSLSCNDDSERSDDADRWEPGGRPRPE
jgi:hypothetical protein